MELWRDIESNSYGRRVVEIASSVVEIERVDNESSDHGKRTKCCVHVGPLCALVDRVLVDVFVSLRGDERRDELMEGRDGNVLEGIGGMPRILLRDVLADALVERYFGEELIERLRVLLGSPDLINLRNVVFHGFLPSLSPIVYEEMTCSMHRTNEGTEWRERVVPEHLVWALFYVFLEMMQRISTTDTCTIHQCVRRSLCSVRIF